MALRHYFNLMIYRYFKGRILGSLVEKMMDLEKLYDGVSLDWLVSVKEGDEKKEKYHEKLIFDLDNKIDKNEIYAFHASLERRLRKKI